MNKNSARSVQNGQFILTSDRGEKISAIEDLRLSHRIAAILRESRARGLSGDERRTLIKEQASRKK
ncbi:hypothetical protein [Mesorhizobium sp.]|uniref:hypothetical protein n=1 Tax=Mesorhizobium sp. TaxID=1871066 RepID=UPI000FE42AC6|nr:hypothetical protein [Mesorhizobium sp.]RWH71443.1 MAG: hypothetical protein EOQ84_15225 [Mesorhizobium sp.]RWL30394.1 MAG: hypothetical protein EOR58_08435 [Mesorhizobium sp.]RWL32565.1 MAG: hypothetical protein EOR63_12475 [Mesorhizobium sp.]RWL39279.1 MAG: hypothetical protein EOR59_10105 [Mesorhizobium sp.]RWL51540.1 MAG: hypothetical protein EOR61_21155 [Mesorhizobium sp.]